MLVFLFYAKFAQYSPIFISGGNIIRWGSGKKERLQVSVLGRYHDQRRCTLFPWLTEVTNRRYILRDESRIHSFAWRRWQHSTQWRQRCLACKHTPYGVLRVHHHWFIAHGLHHRRTGSQRRRERTASSRSRIGNIYIIFVVERLTNLNLFPNSRNINSDNFSLGCMLPTFHFLERKNHDHPIALIWSLWFICFILICF